MDIAGVLIGFILQGVLGGDWRGRLITGGGAGICVFGALYYCAFVGSFRDAALGVGIIGIAAAGCAIRTVALISGLANRKVLYSALTTVVFSVGAFFAFAPLMKE